MLAPTFSAIVHFVSRPQLPAIDGDARLANCLEGFLEVRASACQLRNSRMCSSTVVWALA